MDHYNKTPPDDPETLLLFVLVMASWAGIFIAFVYNMTNK